MTFKEAVEKTPQVAGAYKAGLLAFGDYSSKVVVPDNRLLGGSVDIDVATVELYPNDNRWDYAFDYHKRRFDESFKTVATDIQYPNSIDRRMVQNSLTDIHNYLLQIENKIKSSVYERKD